MKRFKLTLTDEQGVVIEQWLLGTDAMDPMIDYVAPIDGAAKQLIVGDINRRLVQNIKEG